MKRILKKDIFYQVFSTFMLFLLIFDLKVFGKVGSAFVVLLISSFVFMSNVDKYKLNVKVLAQCFNYFFIFYFVLVFFVILRTLVSGADDISYLLTTIKSTIILIATFFYLVVFYDKNILNRIFIIFFINACICLFFGTFYTYKFLLIPFQYGDVSIGSLIGTNEYRNAFLAGSGYFGISSLYAIAFSICLYIVIKSPGFFNYLKLFIVMVAGMLAGRIAVVCYILAFIFFVFKKFSIRYFLGGGVFFILVFIGLNNIAALENVNLWIIDIFSKDGFTQSDSVSQLLEMFYIPNELTFLIGDGRYNVEGGYYYGGVDSGYMRNLLFGGFFFTLWVLVVTFFLLYKSYSIFVRFLIFGLALFLHFKGVFLLNNPGFLGLLCCLTFYFYDTRHVKKL